MSKLEYDGLTQCWRGFQEDEGGFVRVSMTDATIRRCEYSSKKSSVVLHTPYSLFDVYGRAVRAELPRPLFPLLAHWVYLSTIGVAYLTVVLLSVRRVYHGTGKHY